MDHSFTCPKHIFTSILTHTQRRKRKVEGRPLFQLRGFVLNKKEMQLFFSPSLLSLKFLWQFHADLAKTLDEAQPCNFLQLPAHKGSQFHVSFSNMNYCDFIDSNNILIMKSSNYYLYFCKAEVLQKVCQPKISVLLFLLWIVFSFLYDGKAIYPFLDAPATTYKKTNIFIFCLW